MSLKSLCIFLFVALNTSFLFCTDIRNEEVVLMTYPRSGNTWTRYCIEYLTKRPTGWYKFPFIGDKETKNLNYTLSNIFPLGVDYSKPPVFKIHNAKACKKYLKSKYLIIILRDYKECILRHIPTIKRKNTIFDQLKLYLSNLEAFDQWAEDKRLLIYYEDLVRYPKETFCKLTNFFKEGQENVQPFLQEYGKHGENSLSIYIQFEKYSSTEGENVKFHQEKVSHEERLKIDKMCTNLNSKLFSKYLKRYKER